MANNIHGDGLYDVHDALARLAENTALLDRALQRFGRDDDDGDGGDEPPPPYYPPSTVSGTPTEPDEPSQSPLFSDEADDLPEAVAARRRQREHDLDIKHGMTRPSPQFRNQSFALALRITEARYDEERERRPFPALNTNERARLIRENIKDAKDLIRARWRERGLWMATWGIQPAYGDYWPHEDEPTEVLPHENHRKRQRRTRATVAAAANAASRPYNQFVYQVAKERDLLLGLAGDLDPLPLPERQPFYYRTRRRSDPPRHNWEAELAEDEAYEQRRLQSLRPRVPAPLRKAPVDVHSTAYETVKAAWVRWGIWDPRWSIMPGMQWMHEEPLDKFLQRHLAEEEGRDWVDDDDEDDDEEMEEEEDQRQGGDRRREEAARPLPPEEYGDLFGRQPAQEESRPPRSVGLFEIPVPPQEQIGVAEGPPEEEHARGRVSDDFFEAHPRGFLFGRAPSPPALPSLPSPPSPVQVQQQQRQQRRPRGRGRRQLRFQEGGSPAASPPLPSAPAPEQPRELPQRTNGAVQHQSSPPRRSRRLQARAQAVAEAGPSRPSKRTRSAGNGDNDANIEEVEAPGPVRRRAGRPARKRRRGT